MFSSNHLHFLKVVNFLPVLYLGLLLVFLKILNQLRARQGLCRLSLEQSLHISQFRLKIPRMVNFLSLPNNYATYFETVSFLGIFGTFFCRDGLLT